MDIGIYMSANIVYLVRELCLGDCFSLLERRVVVTPGDIGRHFSRVLCLLAEGVRRVTCSFLALAPDILVFCLRAEAEGANSSRSEKRFEDCA